MTERPVSYLCEETEEDKSVTHINFPQNESSIELTSMSFGAPP
jgi:hypothetical protein